MRIATAVFALLVIAAPAAAQEHAHDPSHMKSDGKPPAGWGIRFDKANAKPEEFRHMTMGNTLHVTTGPAATLYKSEPLRGNFAVSATFEMEKPPQHAEAFGLVFAGTNLDKADQGYLYFIIRHDGKYSIRHRGGAEVHPIEEWTEHAAIVKPDAKGKAVNALRVEATPTHINFMVNGKQVKSYERNKPMTAEGVVGLRINHGLDLHVKDFKVEKK